jgi:uncharacterized membrane protein YozB (DUF420 family)
MRIGARDVRLFRFITRHMIQARCIHACIGSHGMPFEVYLQPPGFLGTGASLLADLTLVAYIMLIVPAMIVGFVFARRKLFRPYHKWTMIIITIVNTLLIGVLMVTAYRFDITGNIGTQPGNARYLLPTLHALLGLPAQLLAFNNVYRMLREDAQIAAAKKRGEKDFKKYFFKNAKPFMRLTLALWLATAALGVVSYLIRYEVLTSAAAEAALPPISTPEVAATPEITPEITPDAATVPEIAATPDVTVESPAATPEITPEITPDAATVPEVAATPEITPEITPDAATVPEIAATPELTPEHTATVTLDPCPPAATPDITPELDATSLSPAQTPEITPELGATPTPTNTPCRPVPTPRRPVQTPEVTPEIDAPTPRRPVQTPEVTPEIDAHAARDATRAAARATRDAARATADAAEDATRAAEDAAEDGND